MPDVPPRAPLGHTPPPGPAGGRSILLVIDDEQAVLQMLQDVLEDEGYVVLMAHNGQEGFDRALEGRPDLILTDLMMPVMNGHTLAQRLRAEPRTAQIPLIAMSAAYRARDGDTFDAVIAKPFDLVPLLDLIEGLLDGAP